MNKFDREVQKRKKRALNLLGLGDVSYRGFLGWIRAKLKEDIKLGKVKFNKKKK